jgi:23S rRNA pseudouridine955/2504/2580 synthase
LSWPVSTLNIKIVFEDEDLLVVDKPSGLPTQATVDKNRPNLYTLLLNSKKWPYLGLHHRLDVGTSGLVLLSKNKSLNKTIGNYFRERKIHKTYLCYTEREPKKKNFIVKNYLAATKTKDGRAKMHSVKAGGDAAETHFTVLASEPGKVLIQCEPQTGRMHQIRVHLAELGFAIIGDNLYGKNPKPKERLQLHAYKLSFTHPRTGEAICIECESDDFRIPEQ